MKTSIPKFNPRKTHGFGALLGAVLIASFSLGAGCAHADDQGSQSSPSTSIESLCKQTDFTGVFNSLLKDGIGVSLSHKLSMIQEGCIVHVTDAITKLDPGHGNSWAPDKQIDWSFDLSGKTETEVPSDILKANGMSQLGHDSLQSLRIKLELQPATDPFGPWYQNMKVTATMHLPAVESNKIETDLVVRARISIYRMSPKPGQVAYQVANIGLHDINTRVRAVNDSSLIGPFANAFIKGANYILAFADKMQTTSVILPVMFSLDRK